MPGAPYVPGPGDDWQTRPPERVGMAPGALVEAVAYALAHETPWATDLEAVIREQGLRHGGPNGSGAPSPRARGWVCRWTGSSRCARASCTRPPTPAGAPAPPSSASSPPSAGKPAGPPASRPPRRGSPGGRIGELPGNKGVGGAGLPRDDGGHPTRGRGGGGVGACWGGGAGAAVVDTAAALVARPAGGAPPGGTRSTRNGHRQGHRHGHPHRSSLEIGVAGRAGRGVRARRTARRRRPRGVCQRGARPSGRYPGRLCGRAGRRLPGRCSDASPFSARPCTGDSLDAQWSLQCVGAVPVPQTASSAANWVRRDASVVRMTSHVRRPKAKMSQACHPVGRFTAVIGGFAARAAGRLPAAKSRVRPGPDPAPTATPFPPRRQCADVATRRGGGAMPRMCHAFTRGPARAGGPRPRPRPSGPPGPWGACGPAGLRRARGTRRAAVAAGARGDAQPAVDAAQVAPHRLRGSGRAWRAIWRSVRPWATRAQHLRLARRQPAGAARAPVGCGPGRRPPRGPPARHRRVGARWVWTAPAPGPCRARPRRPAPSRGQRLPLGPGPGERGPAEPGPGRTATAAAVRRALDRRPAGPGGCPAQRRGRPQQAGRLAGAAPGRRQRRPGAPGRRRRPAGRRSCGRRARRLRRQGRSARAWAPRPAATRPSASRWSATPTPSASRRRPERQGHPLRVPGLSGRESGFARGARRRARGRPRASGEGAGRVHRLGL